MGMVMSWFAGLVAGFALFMGTSPQTGLAALKSTPILDKSSPLERLKTLHKLQAEGKPAPDAAVRRQEAAQLYVEQQGKGSAIGELRAAVELKKLTGEGGELAGDVLDMWFSCPEMSWAYFAHLAKDAEYQKADALKRVKIVQNLASEDIALQNTTGELIKMLILEQLAPTYKLPLAERPAARLKAMAEIAAGRGEGDGRGAIGDQLSYPQCIAIYEYMVNDPAWPKTPPRQRLDLFNKLCTDMRVPDSATGDLQANVAAETLRADPGFIASNQADRARRIDKMRQDHVVSHFAAEKLRKWYAEKRSPSGNKPVIVDLVAHMQSDAEWKNNESDPQAQMIKLKALSKSSDIDPTQFQHLQRLVRFRFVQAGEPGKPLAAAVELQRSRDLRTTKDPAGKELNLVDANDFCQRDDVPLMAALLEDPAYARADAGGRLKVLDKYEKDGLTDWLLVAHMRNVLLRLAVAGETAGAAPSQRGAARLKALTKLRGGLDSSRLNYRDELNAAMFQHLLYNTTFRSATPAVKLSYITGMARQGMLLESDLDDFQTPHAIEMLAGNPQFMKSDPAGKKRMIDDLRQRKTIGVFTASAVKRHFKVE